MSLILSMMDCMYSSRLDVLKKKKLDLSFHLKSFLVLCSSSLQGLDQVKRPGLRPGITAGPLEETCSASTVLRSCLWPSKILLNTIFINLQQQTPVQIHSSCSIQDGTIKYISLDPTVCMRTVKHKIVSQQG